MPSLNILEERDVNFAKNATVVAIISRVRFRKVNWLMRMHRDNLPEPHGEYNAAELGIEIVLTTT